MTEKSEFYFEIKPRTRFSLNLQELKEYKELFYFFTWRDIKVKYKQTVLGFLWAVLQPLLMMLIFTFVFGRSLQVPSEGIPYPVFVLSGLILWSVFSSGITSAGNSMVSNAQIIKKIYFPRLIIPFSAILVVVFDFFMAFLVFMGILLIYSQPVDFFYAALFWPLGLVMAVISALGPGCLLAALTVKYRDFRYVIPFLVQALLFASPVIYPVSMIKTTWVQYVLAVNPMYGAITLFRLPLSPGTVDPGLIYISMVSGIAFLLAGFVYFRRTEKYFADVA